MIAGYRTMLAAVAGVLGWAGPAAALTPEQVAVVYNTASEGSKLVAQHYMTARRIPKDNALAITVNPNGANWSEQAYRERIVAPLRKQLLDKKLDKQIICLVTTYDVPFRIPPVELNDAEKAEIGTYKNRQNVWQAQLEASIASYNAIAPSKPATTGPATRPGAATGPTTRKAAPAGASVDLGKLLPDVLNAAQSAALRINALPPDLRGPAMQKFAELHGKNFGPVGLLMVLGTGGSTPEAIATREHLAKLQEQVKQAEERIATLVKSPPGAKARQDILSLQLQIRGLAGAINQSQRWIEELEQPDSASALDNELMLLWKDHYPRARWLGNPMTLSAWSASATDRTRVMMVSRLDGLTPQAVMGMVNQSLKTEKDGLDGVAYFDARGLHGADAYSAFDAELRKTVEYLRANATMKVELDDKPELLQAANCPRAALYCGWYSLRKYQDSCQWLPGAVGYHVASYEAGTLHEPAETGWVTNLLKRGFCGTLGATDEPYLMAFPPPSQYFPLLMSGQFTQGEVYYLTCPMTSWRIQAIGDPLYNPFKAKPAIAVEKIKARAPLARAWEILASVGLGPGEAASQPATDKPAIDKAK